MSRSTRMTLICHGATLAQKMSGFPADEPLIEGAVAFAERIRLHLPHVHTFVSAPERRARQTAAMLSKEFSIDSTFRDIDYGRWAGKSLAEVQASEPENLMAWIGAVDAAPHGGESIAGVVARIAGWLSARMAAGGHTVVVTHPAILRAAIVSVLDAPAESFWKIDAQPGSSAELTSDGRRWALRSLGRLPD